MAADQSHLTPAHTSQDDKRTHSEKGKKRGGEEKEEKEKGRKKIADLSLVRSSIPSNRFVLPCLGTEEAEGEGGVEEGKKGMKNRVGRSDAACAIPGHISRHVSSFAKRGKKEKKKKRKGEGAGPFGWCW